MPLVHAMMFCGICLFFSFLLLFVFVFFLFCFLSLFFFFFQAEDGIRDRSPSRGLGDVYKRQVDTTLKKEITLVKAQE